MRSEADNGHAGEADGDERRDGGARPHAVHERLPRRIHERHADRAWQFPGERDCGPKSVAGGVLGLRR
jgi:hypothetical protein